MPALTRASAPTVVLRSRRDKTRTLPLDAFYLGYQKTALARAANSSPRSRVPRLPTDAALRTYKVSKRYDQDISGVCAASRRQIDDSGTIARGARASRSAAWRRTPAARERRRGRALAGADVERSERARGHERARRRLPARSPTCARRAPIGCRWRATCCGAAIWKPRDDAPLALFDVNAFAFERRHAGRDCEGAVAMNRTDAFVERAADAQRIRRTPAAARESEAAIGARAAARIGRAARKRRSDVHRRHPPNCTAPCTRRSASRATRMRASCRWISTRSEKRPA